MKAHITLFVLLAIALFTYAIQKVANHRRGLRPEAQKESPLEILLPNR